MNNNNSANAVIAVIAPVSMALIINLVMSESVRLKADELRAAVNYRDFTMRGLLQSVSESRDLQSRSYCLQL